MKQNHWIPTTRLYRRATTTGLKWLAFLLMAATGSFALTTANAAAADIFATKGVVYNPGGGSAVTNKSTAYFVGARQGTDGLDIGVWTADGTRQAYIVDNTYGTGAQQTTYNTGSAVMFNDLLYIFVAEYSGTAYGYPLYDVVYYTVDPTTYQVQGGRNVLVQHNTTRIPYPATGAVTPINVAAVVWNNSIYVFGTPSIDGPSSWPLVLASQDGKNWSYAGFDFAASPSYPGIIHDAIVIPSNQVPGLRTSYSSVGDTIVMLVGSWWNSDGTLAPTVGVFYFDPANNVFLDNIIQTLPAPTISTSSAAVANAVAFFGSLNGSINQSAGASCSTYTWSPSVPATLHVIAGLYSSSANIDTLSHWYLDPGTGTWTLNQPCGSMDQIWWPAGGCSATSQICSVAIAPYYYTVTGTSPSDFNSTAQVFSAGFTFAFSGNEMSGPYAWAIPSDYWKAQPGAYQNLSPSEYQDLNDDVSAAMRQLWQLIGVIAGPPPFDGSAFNIDGIINNVSSVDFGYASSTSNQQTGSWESTYAFGDTVKVGPPFLKTKFTYQSSVGTTVTQGQATTTQVTMNDKMGTDTETPSQLGQLGWVYMSGPVIQPELYEAMWAANNTQSLNYTQIAMVIGGNQKLFYPFYLQDPGKVDSSDAGTGVFGLMQGSMSFPLSSDVYSWNQQPQWDYSPENVDTSTYTVLVGQQNQLAQPLQGGLSQIQSFTNSNTTFKTNNSETQSTEDISLKLTIPLDVVSIGNNTEMDMSQGYTTTTTSSSQIDKSVTLSYLVNEDTTITVFPYLLQATSPKAPWVPAGYTGPLPWLLTWYVDGVQPNSGADSSRQSSVEADSSSTEGVVFGRAPLPDQAGGTITGYASPNGATAVSDKKAVMNDFYFVKGGKLAVQRIQGQTIPISMTAKTFDPNGTVSVTINKYPISISKSLGTWTVDGNVWKYTSNEKAGKESVSLRLDFNAMTWDFSVDRAGLWWYTDPLNPLVTVTLDINGKAILSNRICHSTSYQWDADLSRIDAEYGIQSINVAGTFAGKGTVELQGQLPSTLSRFGDFSVVLNDSQYDIPLTKAAGFAKKFSKLAPISYKDKNASFHVNLKTRKWSCLINRSQFLTPRPVSNKDAKTDLRLKIGGKEVFSQRITCDHYKMKLKYNTER